MLVRYLKFTANWNNKLDCKIFSTIRTWYMPPGTELNVLLRGEFYCKAYILESYEINFNELSEGTLMIDTGLPFPECKKLFFEKFGITASQKVYVYLIMRNDV